MNIKFSRLHSILHDTDSFNERNRLFLSSIEEELNDKLVLSNIKDYDCDLKLIFIESGGSEMLFKEAINYLKEPYYFLTSGDNNSLAATLEILTYLNNEGKKGEIIHGDIKYIANRIKALANINKQIDLLKGQRFGVIGTPSDWLISSIPNYNELENKFGIKIVNILLNEVIDNFDKKNINYEVSTLGFDKTEVIKAEKVNELLEDIVNKYNLNGITIRCFDLLNTIKATSCLGLAKLNDKGIIATCEGDVMAMISMALVKAISKESSFQANPSRIDVENNTILFAHCTIPLDMLTSYKYKTHFESGIGLAIKGELKEDTVTVFRLSKDLKHYFVSKAKIIKNLDDDNLCRTQILVKLDSSVSELLNNPCGNHHIIFYGDYVNEIKSILN